jgi:hypothetical protein
MKFTALFGGLIFAAMVLNSHSGSEPHQYADRSSKGDRLEGQLYIASPTPARIKLPAGCDGVVSSLAPKSDLTRVAGRCDS